MLSHELASVVSDFRAIRISNSISMRKSTPAPNIQGNKVCFAGMANVSAFGAKQTSVNLRYAATACSILSVGELHLSSGGIQDFFHFVGMRRS